jgi:hypothetical protein
MIAKKLLGLVRNNINISTEDLRAIKIKIDVKKNGLNNLILIK